MTIEKNNPNHEALSLFPTAKEFNDQVQAKRLAIRADDEAAADRWIISTILPKVNLTIATTTANHFPKTVSVPFEGTELAGHDVTTMQSRIRSFLTDKGYTDITFKDNCVTFYAK